MRNSADIADPVNTTARVELVLEDETLVYLVSVEGYVESDDLTIWKVESVYSDGDRRPSVTDEAGSLIAEFWRVWDNTDNEYRDERYDVLQQLKAAIADDTDECRYERAYHAACESRCGHSL